jgi:hypothetical protein
MAPATTPATFATISPPISTAGSRRSRNDLRLALREVILVATLMGLR